MGGDSPSHPLGCQEKILEAIRGVRGHASREGKRTSEDEGSLFFSGKLARRSLGHNRVDPAAKERRPLFLANAPVFLSWRSQPKIL